MSGIDAFFLAMNSLSASSTETSSGRGSQTRRVFFHRALARTMESLPPASIQFGSAGGHLAAADNNAVNRPQQVEGPRTRDGIDNAGPAAHCRRDARAPGGRAVLARLA